MLRFHRHGSAFPRQVSGPAFRPAHGEPGPQAQACRARKGQDVGGDDERPVIHVYPTPAPGFAVALRPSFAPIWPASRSEERRAGKGGVITCRTRSSQYRTKKTNYFTTTNLSSHLIPEL